MAFQKQLKDEMSVDPNDAQKSVKKSLEEQQHQADTALNGATEMQQEAHQQEAEAREFGQRKCAAFEELHCLLEAKLAASR